MSPMIKRKCCPLCGGAIVVSSLMQYSLNYKINKTGKISKRYKRIDGGSTECSIASCENFPDCNANWDADEFLIDGDGKFIDMKYEHDGGDESV